MSVWHWCYTSNGRELCRCTDKYHHPSEWMRDTVRYLNQLEEDAGKYRELNK